jgi:(p)ppGpp synthase/HD superfamily hydrolase
MVKLADRISNLQQPSLQWGQHNINHYYEESLEIHDELKQVSDFLANRLKTKIINYKNYVL